LARAELVIFKVVQREAFGEEISNLEAPNQQKHHWKPTRNLSAVISRLVAESPETEGFAGTRFEPAGGHDADDSLELACHNSADHDQPAQGRGADRLFNLVPLAVKAFKSL
uniref:Uncharacterized protein n=1 Tax=Anopheles atroparvus TaxID=41427 RepID=A0A182IUM3_ANOAO